MGTLYLTDGDDLTSIANAIRTKGGTSAELAFPADFVSAIEAISGGGGGSGNAQFASGSVTVASTVDIPKAGMLFPGLQLDFVPDFLEIWLDRDSFDSIETPTNLHMYHIMAIKYRDTFPPYRFSATLSSDSVWANKGYAFFYGANVSTFSDPLTGYGVSAWVSIVDTNARPAWSVNSDGTLRIARYSSGTPTLYAGTYRYVAYKEG